MWPAAGASRHRSQVAAHNDDRTALRLAGGRFLDEEETEFRGYETVTVPFMFEWMVQW